MEFICYPKCTTCQKAEKWLRNNGFSYNERNIKEDNPSYDELKVLFKKSGIPLRKFFNTSGLLYKSLDLKNKLPEMSENDQLRLLATDGMLIKRPIVVLNEIVLVGFREIEWKEALNK